MLGGRECERSFVQMGTGRHDPGDRYAVRCDRDTPPGVPRARWYRAQGARALLTAAKVRAVPQASESRVPYILPSSPYRHAMHWRATALSLDRVGPTPCAVRRGRTIAQAVGSVISSRGCKVCARRIQGWPQDKESFLPFMLSPSRGTSCKYNNASNVCPIVIFNNGGMVRYRG